MNQVVARDSIAADQLVYPWPYPVGTYAEVACGEGEVAVMCPAWSVGDQLGPGRHVWHSPDPTKPVSVYFVLTGPVDVPFDMMAQFTMPSNGHVVAFRVQGSVLVRVSDPGLLVAQFVGLPFARVNDGLMVSVIRSVERMLGKVLPRKVAMAGSLGAVVDPSAWPALMEELAGYNPVLGAVHGIHLVRFNHFFISTDDPGSWTPVPPGHAGWVNAANAPTLPGQLAPGDLSGEIDLSLVSSSPDALAHLPQFPLGTRVLVALADGLLHAAVIRQALQGYYELEVGDTGETIWVPMTQVAPQL